MSDTIFALSSGGLPSGVAVLRVSGPKSRVAIETMCNDHQFGEAVFLSVIKHPTNNIALDQSLVLTFVGPKSYTGEDVVEFQIHGGKAVVNAMLDAFSCIDGFRPAEPGEFTYRAYINGKLDLTQAEGVADLIASESESQRILALRSVEGNAKSTIEQWADDLLSMRALIEAEIDFPEEEDIPGSVSNQVWDRAKLLAVEMERHLSSIHQGEIMRDGFRVTLLGKPNAGKSSLLNCLAKRDVAIVSDEPGTTRDIIEVKLIIDGQLVYVSDTAGIRTSANSIEREGISRAIDAAKSADMNIWLHSVEDADLLRDFDVEPDLIIASKSDLTASNEFADNIESNRLPVSVLDNTGVEELLGKISDHIKFSVGDSSEALFSKRRHTSYLNDALVSLNSAITAVESPLEIRAEYLRNSEYSLDKICGKTDAEDILGKIFSEFCVGK